MNERVLLTGAAGFIGSHVAEMLRARGWQVIGVDALDGFYDRDRKLANWSQAAGGEPLHRVDITDAAAIGELVARTRPTGIIHLAAKAGVRPSLADPAGYALHNVVGTQHVLDAARTHGVERLVLASSSSVYGNNPKVPFAEDDDVSAPISPYAATKRACELIAHAHHAASGTPVAMLRFFTVYGPRQRPDLAISLFMRAIAHGEPLRVFGDGGMSRDFTYATDIAAGVLAAYDRIPEHGYRIWNLGSDAPVTVLELVERVAAVVGRRPTIEHAPQPTGDVDRTWADLTRSRSELGYAPATPLDEGLRRQWAWLADQPRMAAPRQPVSR
ncbi:MAG: NAD-dependent epimerase/dehydratase family protein [Planctomycetota bacterium]